jgi:hypothetical protein
MLRLAPLLFLLLASPTLFAQWAFPEVRINTPDAPITDTVYMAPDGDDANPGTFALPVKSFTKALDLLPFGTAGVRGGHAYGLIMLKPGFYRIEDRWAQSDSRWKQGNTYKNVSLEGIGQVTIGGLRDSFTINHMVVLRGSHIYVRNITMQYGNGIGLLINRGGNLQNPRVKHVLIDNVRIDSMGNFAMLLTDIDTITVRHSRALYAGFPGNDTLTTPCQWPSGIKFHYSSWCVIHDTEIGFTRGEGLNYHNSQYGHAYGNRLHDNPTNFYADNSARIRFERNFVYSSPEGEVHWRTCPGDTTPRLGSRGILLANEGACRVGGPVYQNCATNCTLDGEVHPNVDSIYILNNIFVNTTPVFSLWEGVTDAFGFNCIRHVRFAHNTAIGTIGSTQTGNSAIVNAFFPKAHNTLTNSGFAIGEDIRVENNIFSYPKATYPQVVPYRLTRDQLFPVPFDLTFHHNVWNVAPPAAATTDIQDSTLPVAVSFQFDSLLLATQPCEDNQPFVHDVPTLSYVNRDFLDMSRTSNGTNVGALEYRDPCLRVSVNRIDKPLLRVYPNPAREMVTVVMEPGMFTNGIWAILDMTGKPVKHGVLNSGSLFQIQINDLPSGIYLLEFRTESERQHARMAVVR